LDLDYRPFRFPGGARPSAADCAKGICVPVLTPAYVSMGSGNGQKRGSMMMLPNGADPAVIPIDRSPFANVDTKLSLNGGVLIKREVSRTSEALTIVSVPAAIVGAYLDAIAGVFTKRKAALDAKVAYQEAVEALEKKQADPSKVGDGGVKQEAAITGGIGFSIGIAGAYKAPAPILSGAKKEKPVENDGQAPVTSSNDGH
jgi:hypothetical protein